MKKGSQKILSFGRKLAEVVSKNFILFWNKRAMGSKTGDRGAGGDLSKIGDEFMERQVKKCLPLLLKSYHFPGAIVASEELGVNYYGDCNKPGTLVLIIDPIDGSNNLRPHYTPAANVAFSLGITTRSELKKYKGLDALIAAVVVDILNQKYYYASKNGGAYFMRQRIKVSSEKDLAKSVIGTSLDRYGDKYDLIYSKINKVLRHSHCQRRLGSTVLDLMKVATGEYDAYVSLSGGSKLNDLGAAPLIVKEAGGKFNYFSDQPLDLRKLLDPDQALSFFKAIRFDIIAVDSSIMNQRIKDLLSPSDHKKAWKNVS